MHQLSVTLICKTLQSLQTLISPPSLHLQQNCSRISYWQYLDTPVQAVPLQDIRQARSLSPSIILIHNTLLHFGLAVVSCTNGICRHQKFLATSPLLLPKADDDIPRHPLWKRLQLLGYPRLSRPCHPLSLGARFLLMAGDFGASDVQQRAAESCIPSSKSPSFFENALGWLPLKMMFACLGLSWRACLQIEHMASEIVQLGLHELRW